MFRVSAILAIMASATAFTPMGRMTTSSSLKMSFESEIGAQKPLGFWDPLNLLKDADQERFDRLRYVEVKHGRISMLAILGHLVTTAGYRLPGKISYEVAFADVYVSRTFMEPTLMLSIFLTSLPVSFLPSIPRARNFNIQLIIAKLSPSGLKAFDVIPLAGIAQIVAFIGLIELGFNSRQEEIEEAQFEASGWSQEVFTKKQAIELNNGRAAQMGILALMVHEKLDNNPYIINSILGSPVDFNAGF